MVYIYEVLSKNGGVHKMSLATKVNGIIYLSFKYGDFEGERKHQKQKKN